MSIINHGQEPIPTMDRNQRSSSFSIGFKSGERRKKQEKSMFRIKLMAKYPSFPPPPPVINHAIVDSAIKTDFDKWEICHFANTVCTMADGFDRIVSSPL